MTCQTCGNIHQENFCPNCGEKIFNSHELSFGHYVGEVFEGLAHFDNKFFRTVRVLLRRPGQLSLDYTNGRRVRYVKPVQLFVIINLLCFFLLPANPYSQPLFSYLNYAPIGKARVAALTEKRTKQLNMSEAAYEQLFDEKIKSESKEFIFLFLPLYALIFAGLFIRQKRKFVEYLVFATHFYSFMLVYFFISYYLIRLPFYLITRKQYSNGFDLLLSYLTMAVIFVYLFLAIRRYFRPHLLWTIISSGLVAYSFFFFIQYYRVLLFYKIIFLG